VTVSFQRATKKQARLRMAIDGPSGSGKTYTALVFAFALAEAGRVALIDTEHGSASKYADLFPPFDTLELDKFDPRLYIEGIQAAEAAGYEVIVIDSLSHAWEGEGGILELHDQATKRSQSGNSFTAWKDITPIQRQLVEGMLQSSCHIIATMRSKMDYIQTTDEKGRSVIRKVGLAPVQRQGMEYEFDILCDMDADHNLVVSKTRCFAIADQVICKPTAAWFAPIRAWVTEGAPIPPPAPKLAEATTTGNGTQAGATSGNGKQPKSSAVVDQYLAQYVTTKKGPENWALTIRNRFSLDETKALVILGVENLTQYAGTVGDALHTLQLWDAEQAQIPQAAPAEAAQDGAA